MKRESKKYTAVLLSFASVVTLFAACSKEAEESQTTATEITTAVETTEYIPSEFKTEKEKFSTGENGKIYYRENSEDEAYELATDENGITLIDENGNMIQRVTDAQGNEATQPVSFPTFIKDGNVMSCQQFTISLPKGWESSGKINFRFKDFDNNRTIEYSFLEETDKNYKSIEDNIKYLEDAFKPMVDEGAAAVTKNTTQVAGRDAVKLTVEIKNENSSYMETYYVETANGIMVFACFRDSSDKDFDFKAILDTIEYRIK